MIYGCLFDTYVFYFIYLISYSMGKYGKRTAWGGQIVGQTLDNVSKKDEIIPYLQASSTYRSIDSIGKFNLHRIL